MKAARIRLTALFLLTILLIANTGCDFTINKSSDFESENSTAITDKIADTDSDTKSNSPDNPEKGDTQSLHSNSEIGSENKENISDSSNSKEVSEKNISLDFTELTLTVGETKKLTAVVEPNNADGNDISWTSSDNKVAALDENGNIVAYSEGNCIIKAKLISDPSVTASVHVTVRKQREELSSNVNSEKEPNETNSKISESKTPVSGISLSFYEAIMTVGETITPQVTIKPDNAYDKTEIWTSSNKNVATVDGYGNITAISEGSCFITVSSASNSSVIEDIYITVLKADEEEATEPIAAQTPTGETYINGILIVNKTYPLPSSYNPGGLTQECSSQFELLRQGAAADGINIYLSSGFRSYELQEQLYNSYVDCYGQQAADTFSARPGHSEHQTGLAIDCNIIDDSFIGTPEAIWLAEHCYEYGFIIRYPQGKEDITGYKYEPWHIRYVGVDIARDIYNSGLTVEEYLGITSAYDY